jgi:general secretion pathway protein I
MASANTPEQGFTLLETLVALTILSLSVSVLFATFSGGIGRAREDSAGMGARVLAQALLAAAQAQPPLSGSAGASSGYLWKVQLNPESPRENGNFVPEHVSATVRWNSGGYDRSITLGTVIFAPKENLR